MNKEIIIQKLRERGLRITRQRQILLDIILEDECSCCKEIYYKASKLDENIGSATVYRMINLLEEIGAISRKNMYKITDGQDALEETVCTIEFDDNTVMELPPQKWKQIVQAGLSVCGYNNGKKIKGMFYG